MSFHRDAYSVAAGILILAALIALVLLIVKSDPLKTFGPRRCAFPFLHEALTQSPRNPMLNSGRR